MQLKELDAMSFSFLSDRKSSSSGRTAEYPCRTQEPLKLRTIRSWSIVPQSGKGSKLKVYSFRDNKDPPQSVPGEGRYELQASFWVVGLAIIRPAL